MTQDLEKLRSEIEAYLLESNITIFFGYHRMPDTLVQISWDTKHHSDFREFVNAGRAAGTKLMVFTQQAFSLDQIDEALDQLEECDLTREEKRQYESRLRQLQAYEGFTSLLELSFTFDTRIYVFEVHTDWYETFTDLLSELDAATEESVSDEGSLGNYFSNN